MGKTKNKKRKNRTVAPTGLLSVSEIEENDSCDESLSLGASTSRSSRVQTALEKLQSTRVEDKECGANAVSLLVDKKELIAELLSYDVVKIAAPLLVDPSIVVRHSVAGALRNMTVCGGHPTCQIMIEQDILTPLVVLLKQYNHDWTPKDSDDDTIDSFTQTFIEAVNILWNLCESSITAVNVFNQENLLSVLLRGLNLKTYGFEEVTAVAHCLHTVTEDNSEVLDAFKQNPSLMEPVLALLEANGDTGRSLLTKTLAAGICYNLHSACSINFNEVLNLLSVTLDYNTVPVLEKLLGLIEKIKAKNRKKGDNEKVEERVRMEVANDLSDALLAKQLAFEIITNLSCSDDSGEKWEDLSSDASDELGETPAASDDESECTGNNSDDPNPLSIPCDVHEAIVSLNIVNKIGLHMFVPDDMVQKLECHSLGQGILKKIRTVQSRALLCLNNLASTLDAEDFGGSQKMYNVWIQIAQMVFKEAAVKNTESLVKSKELLEAGTSALRAILQKLAEAHAWHHFQSTTADDLEMLFQIEKAASSNALSEPNVRANIVRVTSTMACLMGNSNSGQMPSIEFQLLIKNIGNFLLEVGNKDSELWVSAEALDAIMDVFAEDHLDPLASEISLMEKLKLLLPTLKSRVNQKKKGLGLHYPVVMTAKENLVRFIKYKTSQQVKTQVTASAASPQSDNLVSR